MQATTLQILHSCYEYWKAEPVDPAERVICYSWVEPTCRRLFGTTFHQSRLDALAKQGRLAKDSSSRGGARRYYKLSHPALLAGISAAAMQAPEPK